MSLAVLNTECESLEINEGHLYPEEREAGLSSETLKELLEKQAGEVTNCFQGEEDTSEADI